MKKNYSKPSVQIELFSIEDVVMTSGAEFGVEDFYN